MIVTYTAPKTEAERTEIRKEWEKFDQEYHRLCPNIQHIPNIPTEVRFEPWNEAVERIARGVTQ